MQYGYDETIAILAIIKNVGTIIYFASFIDKIDSSHVELQKKIKAQTVNYSLSCVKTNVNVPTRICMHSCDGHNPWHTVQKPECVATTVSFKNSIVNSPVMTSFTVVKMCCILIKMKQNSYRFFRVQLFRPTLVMSTRKLRSVLTEKYQDIQVDIAASQGQGICQVLCYVDLKKVDLNTSHIFFSEKAE